MSLGPPSPAPSPVRRLRVAAPNSGFHRDSPHCGPVPSMLNPTSGHVFPSEFALVIPQVVLPHRPLTTDGLDRLTTLWQTLCPASQWGEVMAYE